MKNARDIQCTVLLRPCAGFPRRQVADLLMGLVCMAVLAVGCDKHEPKQPTTIAEQPAKPESHEEANISTDVAASSPSDDSSQEFDERIIPLPGRLIVPPSRDAAAMPSGMIAAGDLNGDKLTDLVVLVSTTDKSGISVRRIVAISGADHSSLWSTDSPLGWTPTSREPSGRETLIPGGLRPIPDINADGIPDVFVFGEGERPGFGAVSGKDGVVLGLNSTPKNALIQLVDIRRPANEAPAMFVFATKMEDEGGADKLPRIGFAIYAADSFRRSVSYKKPFGRMSLNQSLLFGPFPDTNGDGVNEILCYGVVPANRLATSDEPQFALVDGQRLKRWVLTQTQLDPTRGPAFIAAPDIVFPDSFTDLIISSPSDRTSEQPSQLGLYVMKRREYRWVLAGNALPDVSESIAASEPSPPDTDVQFGAPVVVVNDLDGDAHRDVATTILDRRRAGSRQLITISSADGRVISTRELPDMNARIEPQLDHVQMAAFHRNEESVEMQIAVSGFVSHPDGDKPVIFLIGAGDTGATDDE